MCLCQAHSCLGLGLVWVRVWFWVFWVWVCVCVAAARLVNACAQISNGLLFWDPGGLGGQDYAQLMNSLRMGGPMGGMMGSGAPAAAADPNPEATYAAQLEQLQVRSRPCSPGSLLLGRHGIVAPLPASSASAALSRGRAGALLRCRRAWGVHTAQLFPLAGVLG